ncbi:MAG: hypothetical protein HND57_01615 [Planctomycetes bacterium]|nr:hypothetical protein [Planctomycetota bacterium]
MQRGFCADLRQRRHRGFSLVELVVIVVVLGMVMAGLVMFLGRARDGCGKQMKCATQLKLIYRAYVIWSQDYGGRFPMPMELNRELSLNSHNPGNSTANLHSYMIYNNYYSPELVICPSEANGCVDVPEEFDYLSADPSGGETTAWWDVDFRCDIECESGSWSNVSYANTELNPGFAHEWDADTLGSTFVIFSDRGPKDGKSDPKSPAYLTHGSRTRWQGNVVFADGSVKSLTERSKKGQEFAWPECTWVDSSTGKKMPDNLFLRDDVVNKSDSWLAVFTSATGEDASGGTKVAWD